MKLRVLICLFLMVIIVSDVTLVAAHTYTPNFDYGLDTLSDWPIVNQFGDHTSRTLVPNLTQGTGAIRLTMGKWEFMIIRENTAIHFTGGDVITLDVHASSSNSALFINSNVGEIYQNINLPAGRSSISFIVGGGNHNSIAIEVSHGSSTVGSVTVDNLRINGIGGFIPPPPPTPINLSHALNFTLAGAMALPTMSIGVVDDIMLIVGKYIKCGLAKFVIRATLLKLAAKGVVITVAITAVSYLFAEFADDIYNAIFATIPEINPGDSHFHETEIPKVMDVINTYFPTEPHLRNAIEQAIRLHIDAHGLISVADVMTIIRQKQEEIIIDVYKETPEILPDNIPVHRDQVPEIMDMIDQYFPVELPIRNIIEQEIHREIDRDVGHEIPIKDVIEIIEREQNIIIDEHPPAFPDYVNEINLPGVIDLIDDYFYPELPIRDVIEEEIYEEIQRDYYNEIPFNEIIDIIEREQYIYIPEIPVETPQQHQEYINEIINRVIHEDIFIPIPATPYIFPGIPVTPTIPRPPKRPDEKIHTFPFYSLFVDPLAAVMGITLAHLFAAMMIIGAIISIGATWGSIGAILAGFIGTITTAYFGLISWLIPLYLFVVFIIYVNIRIRNGGG